MTAPSTSPHVARWGPTPAHPPFEVRSVGRWCHTTSPASFNQHPRSAIPVVGSDDKHGYVELYDRLVADL